MVWEFGMGGPIGKKASPPPVIVEERSGRRRPPLSSVRVERLSPRPDGESLIYD